MNQIQQNLHQSQNILQQNNQQAPVNQPGEINIKIEVQTQANVLSFSLSVDPSLPFNTFQEYVKETIFAQQSQKTFENVLAYIFDAGTIEENEKSTLQQLGLKNDSILKVNLKLKGGL